MIEIPTVVHCKKSVYTMLIDRTTKWGNPFPMGFDGVNARRRCIQQHKEWILNQPHLMRALPELVGQTLGCWCKPEACHGDTLQDLVIRYLIDDEINLDIWEHDEYDPVKYVPYGTHYIVLFNEERGYWWHPATAGLNRNVVKKHYDKMLSHRDQRAIFNLYNWKKFDLCY
jgi:hypothetical protein